MAGCAAGKEAAGVWRVSREAAWDGAGGGTSGNAGTPEMATC